MTGWAAKFGGDLCHGPRPPGPTELHREGVRVEGYQRVPWSKVSVPPTLHLVWFGLTMFDSTWLSLPFGQVATTKYVGFVLVTHSPSFFDEVVVPTPLLLFFGLGTICLRGQSGSRSTRMWRTGALNMGDLPWAESHKTINKGRFWLGHRLKHAVLLVKGPKTSKHVATSLLLHLGCQNILFCRMLQLNWPPKVHN